MTPKIVDPQCPTARGALYSAQHSLWYCAHTAVALLSCHRLLDSGAEDVSEFAQACDDLYRKARALVGKHRLPVIALKADE
jgi:hypothetical protein